MIHMQKCAGTAFAKSIIRRQPDALYWGYDPEGELRSKAWASIGLWKHSTAYEIYNAVPRKTWNAAYKVLVSARHPVERTLSHYAHYVHKHKLDMSLHTFIHSSHLSTIQQYITSPDGAILVDDIVMFDQLEEGLARVRKNTALPALELKIENQNRKKTDILSTTVLEQPDLRYLKSICRWELNYFGWEA
ncbi:hypothetical protein [Acuticoccus mangrovi]|uniref:Sulfotransferase family protein n=1 Tax=Acuticoccus mangrovi TaxID=2796142 RepID=A0A934MGY5_9HYPH|nr:hypothetical protein [Acuticoccus mangrovi]MBJ3777088.1 hypothetical protein [Acuticoccus mangrovi]